MTAVAPRYDENVAELALLEWLGELGWQVLSGPSIGPGEPGAERDELPRRDPARAAARGARSASTLSCLRARSTRPSASSLRASLRRSCSRTGGCTGCSWTASRSRYPPREGVSAGCLRE